MNTHNHPKTFYPSLTGVFLSIMLSLLLSACGIVMAGTPEEAALRDLSNEPTRGSGDQIDSNSIQVLQSSALGARTFVLVSYSGVQGGQGRMVGAKMSCMKLYEMRRAILGMWSPSSANGSCESKVVIGGDANAPEPPPQPISIGGGQTGGDGRSDPGTSTASGQVLDAAIKAVKVTWQDGTSTQADVVNASYIAARTGQVAMMKIEGLDEKGNTVYTWQPEVAPGKK